MEKELWLATNSLATTARVSAYRQTVRSVGVVIEHVLVLHS